MKVFEVYADWNAVAKASKHFSREAEKGLEAMGLLVGEAFSWRGKEFVVVKDYVTARNKASCVSVEFSEEAFPELAGKLFERRGAKTIVGWAHAHPNYGCFLSGTDLKTQRNYFSEPFHVALVMDPVRGEKKFFKLDGENYREASYAIVRKK